MLQPLFCVFFFFKKLIFYLEYMIMVVCIPSQVSHIKYWQSVSTHAGGVLWNHDAWSVFQFNVLIFINNNGIATKLTYY